MTCGVDMDAVSQIFLTAYKHSKVIVHVHDSPPLIFETFGNVSTDLDDIGELGIILLDSSPYGDLWNVGNLRVGERPPQFRIVGFGRVGYLLCDVSDLHVGTVGGNVGTVVVYALSNDSTHVFS